MKKLCFNKEWFFTFEKNLDAFNDFGLKKVTSSSGASARFYLNCDWDKVDLPHDWAITLEKGLEYEKMSGAYPYKNHFKYMSEGKTNGNGVYNVGWYRKEFEFDKSWKDKRVFIEFEGVFRNCDVWVNGTYMEHHSSGYTSFFFEITDHLVQDEINSVAVRVDSDKNEGWWYEGAGIYRNVFLHIKEPVYFEHNKTVVKTNNDGTVKASAVIVNDTSEKVKGEAVFSVCTKSGRKLVSKSVAVEAEQYNKIKTECTLKIENPKLWDVDNPNLYLLRIEFVDKTEEVFGFRTIEFDADKGMLLNGKPCKVRGACVHQDFGGVGTALSDNLNYYKIQRLKDMGVNAYRCSHHAPSPAILRACDELGMLVMDETRAFGTSPEAIRQMTDLIERDRNHPCVFIWCLGNEEFSVENIEWSYRLMEKAQRFAKTLDDTRYMTYGGDNGDNFVGANGAAEVRGINYIRNGKPGWVDKYHIEHPNQPMIGTEESSYVLSRGGHINDLGRGLLDSSGEVTMMWGSTPKGWVKFFEERDYLAGSFMWTGFDYRGEPNPFVYGNVSSSFGTIDLCGMEKPPFYYYKSWWTNEPVIKIAPHWNYKKGEKAKVYVYTNCEKVTLFVNDREIETKTVNKFDMPVFEVAFEKGTVKAVGVLKGKTYTDRITTSGKLKTLEAKTVLKGEKDGDVSIVEITALDKDGNICRLACDELEIALGEGKIVGVGNGDPASFDYEQKKNEQSYLYLRHFNYDDINLYPVPTKVTNRLRTRVDFFRLEKPVTEGYVDDLRNVAAYKDKLSQMSRKTFTTTLENVEKYEYIEFERLSANTSVTLNGVTLGNNMMKSRDDSPENRPYRFYCNFEKGENELKITGEFDEYTLTAFSGYVRLGRTIETPWKVKLHYGKARVFVKSDNPDSLKVVLAED